MPYVYILQCADGSFYTGSTMNLEHRLWQHEHGEGANFTRKHRGAKLVFCEPSDSVRTAYEREKQIQGWSRAKKLALIESRWNDLPGLAKRKR
jgi:putative endonuclease